MENKEGTSLRRLKSFGYQSKPRPQSTKKKLAGEIEESPILEKPLEELSKKDELPVKKAETSLTKTPPLLEGPNFLEPLSGSEKKGKTVWKKQVIPTMTQVNWYSDELVAEAIRLHDAGAAGDAAAVMNAYDLLYRLYHSGTANLLVEGYYGSVLSMIGRETINPGLRMSKAQEGLQILDRAVQKAPDNVLIRLLRGYACYRLPERYFQRTATAIEDFSYAIKRYEKDSTLFSGHLYLRLLLNLGKAYKTMGLVQEANRVWSKLAKSTSDIGYRYLLQKEGYIF